MTAEHRSEDDRARLTAMGDQLDARAREEREAMRRIWRDPSSIEPDVDAVKLWREGDVDCAILRNPMFGTLCGYARLPDSHPWEGVFYDEDVPNPAPIDDDLLVEEAFGDFGVIPTFAAAVGGDLEQFERTMGAQVRVHGGLTYAGPLAHVRGAPHGWWLGFDCFHAGDAPYPEHMPERMRRFAALGHAAKLHVWTVEEVELEVRRLATTIMERRTMDRRHP